MVRAPDNWFEQSEITAAERHQRSAKVRKAIQPEIEAFLANVHGHAECFSENDSVLLVYVNGELSRKIDLKALGLSETLEFLGAHLLMEKAINRSNQNLTE